MSEDFEAVLRDFLGRSQEAMDVYFDKGNMSVHYVLSCVEGRRYVKVICSDENNADSSGYVWAFIDKRNGDILKAASWKAPARHARSNIYDGNSTRWIGPSGPAYLR